MEKEKPAPAEIPPNVQTLVMHEIHDANGDMTVKMDIMYDIPKEVVSNIVHIVLVPMEEKDRQLMICVHCLVEDPNKGDGVQEKFFS